MQNSCKFHDISALYSKLRFMTGFCDCIHVFSIAEIICLYIVYFGGSFFHLKPPLISQRGTLIVQIHPLFLLVSIYQVITWISQFGISHYIKKKWRWKIVSFQTDTNVHFNIPKVHRINSNWWFQHTLAIFLCNMHEPARSPLWLEQTPTDRPASAIREQRKSVFYLITVKLYVFVCQSLSLSRSDSLHLSVLWMTQAVLTAEGTHTVVTDRNPNLRLSLMGRVVTDRYCARAPNWSCVVFTSAPQSGEMGRK